MIDSIKDTYGGFYNCVTIQLGVEYNIEFFVDDDSYGIENKVDIYYDSPISVSLSNGGNYIHIPSTLAAGTYFVDFEANGSWYGITGSESTDYMTFRITVAAMPDADKQNQSLSISGGKSFNYGQNLRLTCLGAQEECIWSMGINDGKTVSISA